MSKPKGFLRRDGTGAVPPPAIPRSERDVKEVPCSSSEKPKLDGCAVKEGVGRLGKALAATRDGKRTTKEPLPELDSREWDFKKIDPNELRACYFWEYARETLRASECSVDLNATLRDSEKAMALKRLLTPFPGVLEVIQKLGGDAPAWIRLRTRLKEDLMECAEAGVWVSKELALSRSFQAEMGKQKDPPLLLQLGAAINSPEALKWFGTAPFQGTLNDFATSAKGVSMGGAGSAVGCGFVAINWRARREHIEEAAVNWIRKEYQKRGMPLRSPSRGKAYDRLTWLGCKRVADYYPNWQLSWTGHAGTENVPRLAVRAPVTNRSRLITGRTNAREVLKKFGRLQIA